MTGCLDLALWSLAVLWFVLVMVWVVVCWLRCWRKCRGFRQLREGSDDPPPPGEYGSVRLGGCDAQACQQADQDGHHRQDATQAGNQMHETKTPSPNTKRYQHRLPNKVLPVGKPPNARGQPVQQTAQILTEANCLLDIPRFSPYHPARQQHTSRVSHR